MLFARGIVSREVIRVGGSPRLQYTLSKAPHQPDEEDAIELHDGQALATGGVVINQGARRVFLLTNYRHVAHDTNGRQQSRGIGSALAGEHRLTY